MSNENTGQNFKIQKIYLKDVSFESPNSPGTFNKKEWKPEVNVQINSSNQAVSENIYEVVLTITITAKQGEETAFLVEVKQAGVFSITGFTQDAIGGVLGAYCPEALFPFAREAISDLVGKGGFPQLLLAPVDFNSLYNQHVQQQQQASAADQDTAH